MKSVNISRRRFIRNSFAAIAGVAAVSALSGCSMVTALMSGSVDTEDALNDTANAFANTHTNPLDLAKRTVLLNNGIEMPVFGIGTYILTVPQAENSVYHALNDGYRLVDTAAAYNNEEGVGKGIARAIDEGIVKREDIFVTTKLWPSAYNMGGVDAALERLGLDYVDLMLLHQPMGDYINGWKALEQALADGKVRAIGLSNFYGDDFVTLMNNAVVPPALLQVETHLKNQQNSTMEMIEPYGIVLEAWFPLGGKGHTDRFFNFPEVQELAQKYGKTPAQIIIRWHLQENHICIPGSSNPDHILENIGSFDFEIEKEDILALNALNEDSAYFYAVPDNLEENGLTDGT